MWSLFRGCVCCVRSDVAVEVLADSFPLAAQVSGGQHIMLQHAGADLCVRTVYHPDKWPLRISVADGEGHEVSGTPTACYDVGGPCCFRGVLLRECVCGHSHSCAHARARAGDMLAANRELPVVQPGYWILLHDTGGYYHSAYRFVRVCVCVCARPGRNDHFIITVA